MKNKIIKEKRCKNCKMSNISAKQNHFSCMLSENGRHKWNTCITPNKKNK